MKNDWKRVFARAYAVLLLSCALQAEEECPIEVKLLLPPPTVQSVIASLGFVHEAKARVYFFDTDKLELLRQGVIMRVRQGADNDLTAKVRVPESNMPVDFSRTAEHFPCEIDRTGAGENVSYSVQRTLKVQQVPETGAGISNLLSPPQGMLLKKAGVSIEWVKVTRIANIKSTKWQSTTQPRFRKLSLERWEWPGGEILELSTKVGPGEGDSTNAELQELVKMKGLSLSANQGTKTKIVLETLTGQPSIAGGR